jgi:hypothetical protein
LACGGHCPCALELQASRVIFATTYNGPRNLDRERARNKID